MLAPSSVLQSRYRIIRTLGVGGMGAVYLAQDTRLASRQVAVKEMVPDPTASAAERMQAQQLFQQEASILASLDHPNLPRVYDYFSESGNHYLVMDYIDGETLEEILNGTPGFLPEGQVLDWAKQLADVLTYLHSRQPPVIFRDLKPGNIMVDRSGEVKLIDFGIARFFKPGKPTDTLKMGTTGYAPPEQYAGQGQTDARSDIYSLGATLHHLLTRRDPTQHPPFSFDTAPPRGLNPTISPHVEAAITRALAYDRSQRFQSASEMKRALLPPAPRRGSVQRIRPFLLIAAVVLLVVMALTVTDGWGKFLRPAPTPGPVIMTTPTTPPATATPMPATQVPPTPGRSVSVPTDTPSLQPPTPTATSRPADTPTADLVAVVDTDTLNVRSGPSTQHKSIAQVHKGDRLMILGRNPDCVWYEVAIPADTTGWVASEYLHIGIPRCSPPEVPTPTLAPCLPAQGLFKNLWQRYQDRLGCPLSGWQSDHSFGPYTFGEMPFQHGHMFWYKGPPKTMWVVYGSGRGAWTGSGQWSEYADTWEEGDPEFSCPPERPYPEQPKDGFGKVWCDHPEVRTGLGWGLERMRDQDRESPGASVYRLQRFEGGFVFRDSDGWTHSLAYVFFDDGTFVRDSYR